jgi:hypothetical protein
MQRRLASASQLDIDRGQPSAQVVERYGVGRSHRSKHGALFDAKLLRHATGHQTWTAAARDRYVPVPYRSIKPSTRY